MEPELLTGKLKIARMGIVVRLKHPSNKRSKKCGK
jgi:hypothetical protein